MRSSGNHDLFILFLMSVLSQPFFALMGRDLMSFSLSSTRHITYCLNELIITQCFIISGGVRLIKTDKRIGQ